VSAPLCPQDDIPSLAKSVDDSEVTCHPITAAGTSWQFRTTIAGEMTHPVTWPAGRRAM
jgi:hypothetical protein